jgi:hypothetical protein
MFERTKALELIERAIDTDPYCLVCGAPTMIQDEDGLIYLRCSTLSEPHGFFGRVGVALQPHLRRELLDLRPGLAA